MHQLLQQQTVMTSNDTPSQQQQHQKQQQQPFDITTNFTESVEKMAKFKQAMAGLYDNSNNNANKNTR